MLTIAILSFLISSALLVYHVLRSLGKETEGEEIKKEVKAKKKKKEEKPPISYLYETPELREKNRKAIQAWLLKHTGSTELKHPTRLNQRRRRMPRWEEPEDTNPYYYDDEEYHLRKLDGEF